jgi:hypothetical protein
MHEQLILGENWAYLLSFLSARSDLERSAASFGAIRRVREITSASVLLRLMMAYGFCGMSLRRTAAWAAEAGVATISDVALLDRFRNGAAWLGHLLAVKLADHAALVPAAAPQLNARLIDASSITRAGRGTDWRLHMTMNLAALTIDDVSVTDVAGEERLSRFTFRAGEVAVADALYAHRDGLESVIRDGADFLVRIHWSNLPLLTLDGQAFDVLAHCRQVEGTNPSELQVRIRGSNMPPVRLLIVRKTEAAASEGRRRDEQERTKKGVVHLRTVEATEYVMLLASPASDRLTAEQAFELYRFRWHVESTFKRLKPIIDLGRSGDEVPAKNAALAQVILLAKLLGALLVDDYTERYVSFSPWGYPIGAGFPSAVSVAHR